jgi:dTMP kinase
MATPARFIVLDGNEGCGKSTQARLLQERLVRDGIPTVLVRDPGTAKIGERIRAILLDPLNVEMAMRCEMLLYMAARAQLMGELILPALAAGKTVICDRFVSSTLAYQLAGDGLSGNDIRAVADVAIKGRWPDLVIILDMPPEASMARVKRAKDRIEQRPPAYHEQVRKNYLAQVEERPQTYRLVSAEGTIEDVQARVWDVFGEGTKARRHGGTK